MVLLQRKTNRKSYAARRMAPFPITLNDLKVTF